MVNIALTVNLFIMVTKEAQQLIELAIILFLFFKDAFIFVYLYD